MAFQPNAMTFAEGAKRADDACKAAGLDISKGILTSKDAGVINAVKALKVSNIPNGFEKYQLPIVFQDATQTYLSFGAAGTSVPMHSHDEGPGLRVIIFGSIVYKDVELTAGDWMYIPAGMKYALDVGSMGVGMFYCYQCSCA